MEESKRPSPLGSVFPAWAGPVRRIRAWGRLLPVFIFGLLCWITLSAREVEEAEQLAFDAAVRDFDLGQWERAAGNFDAFSTQFPDSTLKPEALLRRDLARAQVELDQGNHQAAADAFARFAREYAPDPRTGLAVVREAQARLKLGDSAGALQALEAAEGPFARQLAEGTDPSLLLGGLLVKVEALRAAERWADAVAALAQAEPLAQTPAERAARWQLLVEVEESAGQLEPAAQAAEEWAGTIEDSPGQRAEANARAGRLWKQAGKSDQAEAAFSRNLAAEIPVGRQREAVTELADLALAREDFATARDRLQAFLAAQPSDPAGAALRLRLGQTLFREFLAVGGPTNATAENLALLTLASAQFATALTNAPPAEIVGALNLGRGWSLWQEGVATGNRERYREAGSHFAAAANALPRGLDQATAWFKLGDIQLRLNQPAAALTNFLAVIRDYADVPEVQPDLVKPALIQAAQAAVGADQREEAASAIEELLKLKPTATEVGPSALLVGQALAKAGETARARKVLEQVLEAFPTGRVAADVELALAVAESRARQWTNALASLDRWVTTHTNHPRLPQAEFDRAWAAAQAGQMTNAVSQFAALSARFPTNPIAQNASLWLAGHYFSLGEYAQAEQVCVNVFTNAAWRGTPGWHQARLWRAEAARRRQSFASAREQLLELLNDQTTPANLFPSAYFALGETHLEQPPAPDAAPLAGFQEALLAFTAAAQFTNSPVAVAALGKMADCHLQLAAQATNSYTKADELYRRVVESPRADLAARSKAAVGRGLVAEKQAAGQPAAVATPLLETALNHYLDVVNGTLVRSGETPDPWWLKEAGREAGRLLESLGRWAEAAVLYDRLTRELPALKPAWELRAQEARKRASR